MSSGAVGTGLPRGQGILPPVPAPTPDVPGSSTSVTTVTLGPSAAGRCRRRVHLDADPTADRSARTPPDDGLRQRIVDADEHRAAVLRVLRGRAGVVDGRDWDPADPDHRPAVVIGPELSSATRFGRPDLLVRVGGRSAGYVPVLIRAHRSTDVGSGALVSAVADLATVTGARRAAHLFRRARAHQVDALALAHHHRLLQELGLAGTEPLGGVIGRGVAAGSPPHDDAAVVLWHELAADGQLRDYDTRFADRLAVAVAASTGGPALALPSRVSECRRCPWWSVCEPELKAAHDVSLVASGTDVKALREARLVTIDDLAAAPADLIQNLALTDGMAGTARVRARAWLAALPLVRRAEAVGVPRADLELDVDMESYLEDGAYLWGTYLSGPAVGQLGLTPGYRPFVTWRPLPDPDEGRAFAEFWAYLDFLRGLAARAGLTFAAYCYSRQAEERWLRSTPRRFPAEPGMPEPAAVEEFCAGPQWIDVYQQIREQFVVPGSMKLKVLARLTGFRWRDVDPGGENSMAWYRTAVGGAPVPDTARGPREPVDHAMARRLLAYNEDDVLATLALRQWIDQCGRSIPTAAELDADPGGTDRSTGSGHSRRPTADTLLAPVHPGAGAGGAVLSAEASATTRPT